MIDVPNQTIVPPIQVGKAPGSTQVNLGQMQSNLSNVLQPGMLGNNVANPMTDIINAGGNAGLGYQNAIANSRMQDIALQAQEQALQQAEQQWKYQQQQPGLLDYLGLGVASEPLIAQLLKSNPGSAGAIGGSVGGLMGGTNG